MKEKDMSFDLFANLPHSEVKNLTNETLTEIVFQRDKPLKILTHGNGFHYIMKNTKIFICDSDKFTDIFDPKQDKFVKKVISPYRISYRRGLYETKLYDCTKAKYRAEAMTIIQKAMEDDKDVVEIPNFFEKEWREKRRLKK